MSPTTVADQTAALHKQLENIADEVRGQVDGWDLKGYVLGILFYRYISERIADYVNYNQAEAGVALPANRGQVTKLPQGPGQQVC